MMTPEWIWYTQRTISRGFAEHCWHKVLITLTNACANFDKSCWQPPTQSPLAQCWSTQRPIHPPTPLFGSVLFLSWLFHSFPRVCQGLRYSQYIETSDNPIFRSLYLFCWPLPLWNSDADADLESHPVDQLFTRPSFPVLQMQPGHKASPEFSLFRAVHPI